MGGLQTAIASSLSNYHGNVKPIYDDRQCVRICKSLDYLLHVLYPGYEERSDSLRFEKIIVNWIECGKFQTGTTRRAKIIL